MYQWAKQKVVIEKPQSKKVAVLTPLTQVALIDGDLYDFSSPIQMKPDEGYAIPIALAMDLATRLGLGMIREEREPERADKSLVQPLTMIVIDPGHGGSDLGTGQGGLREKDIALIYALALKDSIQAEIPDLKVKLTREDDRFVSLADRARLANNVNGGLFLSIHVNHAADSAIAGAETFILSPEATDNESKKTALAENKDWIKNIRTKGMPDSQGLRKIFVDLEQQRFIQQSAVFASYVQQELARIDHGKAVKNRGVKQADRKSVV